MKAFVPAAALAIAAAIVPCIMALPAGDDIAAVERRQGWSSPAPTISASGANGGINYYGSGAQGGTISIQKPTATPAPNINANGANGGFNFGLGSNGANGGRIAIGRREEHQLPYNYQFPNYQYSNPYPTASLTGGNGGTAYNANGANGGTVTAHQPSTPTNLFLSGANGGLDVGGSTGGANGGTVSLNRRNKEQYSPGYVSASGANGGTNIYGNGANGGGIGVNPNGYGSVNANGANGGYNYGGNGANGGGIGVNPNGYYGSINANGANGGYNYGGSGANGGSISIGRRDDEQGVNAER